MIYEWVPNEGGRNLGDAMGEFVVESIPDFVNHQNDLYFPIGSVIADGYIKYAVDKHMTPVFIGCGWMGREINPELAKKAKFQGVRGPETVSALERAGVFGVQVTGDSAYLALKKMDITPKSNGKTVFVPHITDAVYCLKNNVTLGADTVISPEVRGRFNILDTIRRISQAEFVIGGAMHACIIAHYFGIPFAPASAYLRHNNDRELAVKWHDWLASLGVQAYSVRTARNIDDAEVWWTRITDTYDLQPQFDL